MAVVMQMRWAGVTAAQYDEVREIVGWETDVAEGGLFHVASFDDGGMSVTDVWETPEHFARFNEERLAPAVEKVGVAGEPEVTMAPAHRVFDSAHGAVLG
jgi:hypothetical protein